MQKFFTSALILMLSIFCLTSCIFSSSSCNLTDNRCSCNLFEDADSPRCIDYEGQEPDSATSLCTDAGGTFAETACITDRRIGTCTMTIVNEKQHSRYYLDDFTDALTARAACEYLWLNFQAIPGADFDWVSDY